MEIGIQIVILFVLIYIYLSSSSAGDAYDWLRALILAVALTLLAMLPIYLGFFGWIIYFILALVLVSKMLGQSISGSILFLLGLGILQYIIQLGIYKYM